MRVEKAEELIDNLCGELGVKYKPMTYRRNARKAYLNLSKKKRKTDKVLRKGIRQQLGTDLVMQLERYQVLQGHYPKVVLFDKIYLNI